MKRLMMVLIVGFALAAGGCGLKAGLDYKPDGPSPRALYQDLDHLKFSWYGYKHPTPEQAKESHEQNWWGTEVPYIPAQ